MLIAYSACGGASYTSYFNFIHVGNPIVTSSFIINNFSGCKPLHVPFTNTSTNATSYLWKFSGGGGTSTLTNPTHSYSHSGMDTVTLIAYDSTACGVFSDTSTQ